MTTYHVYVHTSDKMGAGTDANVYILLFGEEDDTGKTNIPFTNQSSFLRYILL